MTVVAENVGGQGSAIRPIVVYGKLQVFNCGHLLCDYLSSTVC